MNDAQPLLAVRDLQTWFPVRAGFFQRVHAWVRAVDGVSFDIPRGRTLALVGESGCGKTTVGKSLLKLVQPRDGRILYQGRDLVPMTRRQMWPVRKKIQIIFQDPANSLDPRMLVRDVVGEGLRSFNLAPSADAYQRAVVEAVERVGLSEDALFRYPQIGRAHV